MIRLLAIAAAWLVLLPAAFAQTVSDPEAFIRDSYETLERGGEPPRWGAPFYTDRMLALFAEDEQVMMDNDGMGRLDFGFWVAGQDWDISNVSVTARAVTGDADRRVVTAEFSNFGEPNTLHFYWERTPAGWRLDDVSSDSGWTLSLILKYG